MGSVEYLLWKRNTFHSAVIGGRTFEAVMSADGPYVKLVDEHIRYFGKGVALGNVIFIAPDDQGDYAVFKYDTRQHRFSLTGFSDEEVAQFSAEFGIRIGRFGQCLDFLDSPAGKSLASWVQAHPRIAKGFAECDSYVPNWFELAQAMSVQQAA